MVSLLNSKRLKDFWRLPSQKPSGSRPIATPFLRLCKLSPPFRRSNEKPLSGRTAACSYAKTADGSHFHARLLRRGHLKRLNGLLRFDLPTGNSLSAHSHHAPFDGRCRRGRKKRREFSRKKKMASAHYFILNGSSLTLSGCVLYHGTSINRALPKSSNMG